MPIFLSLFWWIFLGTFHWCRKVTTHNKCPRINVLCVAMHKWWNEPKMGDGENWTNGKVRKTESTENLCLLFSECRKVTTQKCFKHSHTSMLKQNLGWVTGKTVPTEKFGKLNWQNFLSLDFQVWNISISHYKKIEKWLPFLYYRLYGKISNYWPPPKFRSPVFQVSMEMEYQCWPLWKNWKMAAISLILIVRKNFQLPTPQSLSLHFSECWWKQNISVSHYEKLKIFSEFPIGSFSPITHPRLHFNIYVWQHLKHLWVDIYAWFTSHLCAVLHFLIFFFIFGPCSAIM